jgi:hypothetical protein
VGHRQLAVLVLRGWILGAGLPLVIILHLGRYGGRGFLFYFINKLN